MTKEMGHRQNLSADAPSFFLFLSKLCFIDIVWL